MAKLDGIISFTGSLRNISMYKRKDLEGTFVRMKGGPDPEKVKTGAEFEGTREAGSEFGARSTMGSWIKRATWTIDNYADYNFHPALQPIIRTVQLTDIVSDRGRRSVCLSKMASLLEGFSLNRKNRFETIVRASLDYTFNETGTSVTVSLPALLPNVNLFPPNRQPYVAFTVVLGLVPDIKFREDLGNSQPRYFPKVGDIPKRQAKHQTEWFPVSGNIPATEFSLEVRPCGVDSYTAMITVGVCFGTVAPNGSVEELKYTGAGKILAARGFSTENNGGDNS